MRGRFDHTTGQGFTKNAHGTGVKGGTFLLFIYTP